MRFLWAFVTAGLLVAALAVGQPENSFRFAIVGDRTGGASSAVYEQVWREVDQSHPDFVINVGDVIEGGKTAAAAEAEWESVRRVWESYHYPLFFTPGNHDIWNAVSRKLYAAQTGRPASYGFDFQNAHFTVLDNSAGPLLSDDQMQFLERDVKANSARAPKFVFFHEPFWIVPLKLGSGEFPLHQLARRHGIGYVFSGHGHQLVRIARDGVTYVEVGSSGASLRRGLDRGEGFEQGWFYQYATVVVKGTAVDITVKELGPPAGKGRKLQL